MCSHTWTGSDFWPLQTTACHLSFCPYANTVNVNPLCQGDFVCPPPRPRDAPMMPRRRSVTSRCVWAFLEELGTCTGGWSGHGRPRSEWVPSHPRRAWGGRGGENSRRVGSLCKLGHHILLPPDSRAPGSRALRLSPEHTAGSAGSAPTITRPDSGTKCLRYVCAPLASSPQRIQYAAVTGPSPAT